MRNLICFILVVFLVSCGSGNKVNKAAQDNYTITGDTLNLFVGKRAALAVFEAVYF